MSPIDPEMEERIEEFFDRNLRELEADRGHALAPGVRQTALQQVKLYYRRLSDIAEKVTDTEVRLGLPARGSTSLFGMQAQVRSDRFALGTMGFR